MSQILAKLVSLDTFFENIMDNSKIVANKNAKKVKYWEFTHRFTRENVCCLLRYFGRKLGVFSPLRPGNPGMFYRGQKTTNDGERRILNIDSPTATSG